MKFGDRMQLRREELGLSRGQLAEALGLTASAIGNYEQNISFPRAEILLRLFDLLKTDPNELFQDSFRIAYRRPTPAEETVLRQYRDLSQLGKESLRAVLKALLAAQEEAVPETEEPRLIPLYRSPAAAGYAAPVFGEDFDYVPVTEEVPPAAEYGVRIQGDSMAPWIEDGSVVYVNRDPLAEGDIGIFYVDGDILCKQYYRDPLGFVYLFSLNRSRADADVVLPPESGRRLACFGRVLHRGMPLPGR